MELLKQHLIAKNPVMEERFAQTLEENTTYARQLLSNDAAAKTTANDITIPVVFHIVLTDAQITQLGGPSGVAKRADSQIAVLNRDFNGTNSDVSQIPANFKRVFGKANISFALAHTDPKGAGTPGYEIITTTQPGFEESSSVGSGMGFSSGKYVNGPATSWDADKYLNIWVFNLQDNGAASGILGLTIPPSFLNYGISGLTKDEVGIVLNYGAFGKYAPGATYYISGINGGRTLTHEMGHFFEIWHVWGDDNGKCPGAGGKDDGITDTPPQSNATYGCPSYPLFDSCTKTGDGIMFMNFMDYVNDACMHMFTAEQAKVMSSQTMAGKESYSLTLHPELTSWPTGVSNIVNAANVFNVYPNPSTGSVNITLLQDGVNNIRVTDVTGRIVENVMIDKSQTSYTMNLSDQPKGMYIIHCSTGNGDAVSKLILQ